MNKFTDITCYIHNVSPIKKSGTTKYFNYVIQTKSDVRNGVCFAVDKRETLDSLAQQHSPVKIHKYSLSNKFGRKDIVINKNTLITPTTLDFKYQDLDDVTSIALLSQVTAGQLVKIKGHVAHLSPTRTVLLDAGPVKKQEAFINDPSGYIKLVLWGSHADSVSEGSTRLFDKVRVKLAHQEKYLNTPKNEDECKISSVANFTESLQPVENISTVKDLTGKILGVTNLNKYHCCCSCNKNVTIKGNLAFCNNCSMTMKLNCCKLQCTLKLYIQETSNPHNRVRVSVYNDVFSKVLGICNLLAASTDEEIIENILDLELVKVSYDTQSNKVIDIDQVKI